MAVLKVIQELLSTPSILVGLMALIGLCLQKKPIEDVVKGTIKTIVGFLVLSAGSSFLQTGSLNDFGTLFNFAFNVQGVVPNNEAIVTSGLVEYAGPVTNCTEMTKSDIFCTCDFCHRLLSDCWE